MNNKRLFFKTDKSGLVLGAVLLVTLTGCVGYVDRPSQGSVYVEPSVAVVVEDDYVYYPNYEVYYSSSRHQYAYREGSAWVARPAPRGVAVDVLVASPSVRMNFHDSPANHHAVMAKQYPKNWAPPHGNQGQKSDRKDDRKDDQRDGRGENNKR